MRKTESQYMDTLTQQIDDLKSNFNLQMAQASKEAEPAVEEAKQEKPTLQRQESKSVINLSVVPSPRYLQEKYEKMNSS